MRASLQEMNVQPPRSCDIDIRVRYAEVDAMGFLHHANYFVFFEQGRTELMRLCGVRYRDLEARGFFYAVAKLQCRFRAPARYDDVITLRTTSERVSPIRVEHSYRVTRDGVLLTEATSTVAVIGRDGRLVPLPDDIYQHMAPVADDAPLD